MSTNELTDLDPADFPPTSIAIMALHPLSHLGANGWFACQHPESPPDAFTSNDWRCPRCVAAAKAELRINGDQLKTWRYTPTSDPVTVTLSWMVARAEFWAGQS